MWVRVCMFVNECACMRMCVHMCKCVISFLAFLKSRSLPFCGFRCVRACLCVSECACMRVCARMCKCVLWCWSTRWAFWVVVIICQVSLSTDDPRVIWVQRPLNIFIVILLRWPCGASNWLTWIIYSVHLIFVESRPSANTFWWIDLTCIFW